MTDSEVSLSPLTITRFGGKTRDRILRQSLVLLNGEGFQSTTTAALAANSDVKEGTLWYHFRTKNDLVSAHLQILDELLRDVTTIEPLAEDGMAAILERMLQTYRVLWDFRYLLRDLLNKSSDEAIAARIDAIRDLGDARIRDLIAHAFARGFLVGSVDEQANLGELILIVGTYWFDFSANRYPERSEEAHRIGGITMILHALRPAMSARALETLTEIDWMAS